MLDLPGPQGRGGENEHGRRNRGQGAGGGGLLPPHILPTPKNKEFKNKDI